MKQAASKGDWEKVILLSKSKLDENNIPSSSSRLEGGIDLPFDERLDEERQKSALVPLGTSKSFKTANEGPIAGDMVDGLLGQADWDNDTSTSVISNEEVSSFLKSLRLSELIEEAVKQVDLEEGRAVVNRKKIDDAFLLSPTVRSLSEHLTSHSGAPRVEK